MALLEVTADFGKLVATLERIALDLQHGIRILESAFPIPSAAAHWQTPANDFHYNSDQALLEREDEERREKNLPPVVSELGDEGVYANGDNPWNL